MSNSSFTGGTHAPAYAAGRDVDALGPSDTSDSGSDIQGEIQMGTGADNPGEWGALTVGRDNDSDSLGTGERASASGDAGIDGADILPDRIFDPELEAGADDELLAATDAAELPDESIADDLESDTEDDEDSDEDVETGRSDDSGRSESVKTER